MISALKEFWFMMSHDPNSLEGLQHRLEKLRKKGFSEDSLGVVYLKTMIRLKEGEKNVG